MAKQATSRAVIVLRKRGMTLAGWCRLKGFHYNFTNQIINGHAAKWRVGQAAKIINALVVDGLWAEPKKRKTRKTA